MKAKTPEFKNISQIVQGLLVLVGSRYHAGHISFSLGMLCPSGTCPEGAFGPDRQGQSFGYSYAGGHSIPMVMALGSKYLHRNQVLAQLRCCLGTWTFRVRV